METATFNQPTYLKNVLTSERKSENLLHWVRAFAFVSRRNKTAIDFSKISRDQIWLVEIFWKSWLQT